MPTPVIAQPIGVNAIVNRNSKPKAAPTMPASPLIAPTTPSVAVFNPKKLFWYAMANTAIAPATAATTAMTGRNGATITPSAAAAAVPAAPYETATA